MNGDGSGTQLECRTHPMAGHLEHTQSLLERKGTLKCLGMSEVRVVLPQFQFGWRCSLGKTFLFSRLQFWGR